MSAGGLLFLVLLSACSSSAGTEANPEKYGAEIGSSEKDRVSAQHPPAVADLPADLPDSPISSYIDSLIDPNAVHGSETELYAQTLAECMQDAGFDFVEYVPQAPQIVDDGIPSDESSVEWISVYGFGISTLAFEQQQLNDELVGHPGIPDVAEVQSNPNREYYASLSSADQAAFDAAMEGQTSNGCRHKAEIAGGHRHTIQQDLLAQFRSEMIEIDERVEADTRVQAFLDDLRLCVRDRGYEFVDMGRTLAEFEPRVDRLVAQLPTDPLDQIDEAELDAMTDAERSRLFESAPDRPPPLPQEYYTELAQIQKEEVALALAVHDCGSMRTLADLRFLVRAELEEEFLDSNEALLLAFAEANN